VGAALTGIGDRSHPTRVRACMASYAESMPPSSLMREATALISTWSCINLEDPLRRRPVPRLLPPLLPERMGLKALEIEGSVPKLGRDKRGTLQELHHFRMVAVLDLRVLSAQAFGFA
jgi:hypothetical protein